MTIQERLRRSNIIMLVIPILIAGILLILGFGGAIVLLESVYLPRMGLTTSCTIWEKNWNRCFRV